MSSLSGVVSIAKFKLSVISRLNSAIHAWDDEPSLAESSSSASLRSIFSFEKILLIDSLFSIIAG